MFLEHIAVGWRRNDDFKDVRLEALAAGIPDLLKQARAPNTNKAYTAAFNKWASWASQFPEVEILPASPSHIILYLSELSKSAKTFATVNQFLSAASWMHAINGHLSPTTNVVVQEVINGIKRSLACPVLHKEPFTADNIKSFITIMDKGSLTDVRNTVMISLAFFAFLRVDELLHIRVKDVLLDTDHLQLTLPLSKTDQLRQGSTVVVAKTGGPGCPIALLLLYLSMSSIKITKASKQFLFSRIIFKKGVLQMFEPFKAISYSNIRDVVKKKASQIGLNPALYSTHSMRSGGATAAAESGVSERIMQKHGRWACSSSKDRYVKDSLSKRLKVSANLLN